jgi:hypothetical protein
MQLQHDVFGISHSWIVASGRVPSTITHEYVSHSFRWIVLFWNVGFPRGGIGRLIDAVPSSEAPRRCCGVRAVSGNLKEMKRIPSSSAPSAVLLRNKRVGNETPSHNLSQLTFTSCVPQSTLILSSNNGSSDLYYTILPIRTKALHRVSLPSLQPCSTLVATVFNKN